MLRLHSFCWQNKSDYQLKCRAADKAEDDLSKKGSQLPVKKLEEVRLTYFTRHHVRSILYTYYLWLQFTDTAHVKACSTYQLQSGLFISFDAVFDTTVSGWIIRSRSFLLGQFQGNGLSDFGKMSLAWCMQGRQTIQRTNVALSNIPHPCTAEAENKTSQASGRPGW